MLLFLAGLAATQVSGPVYLACELKQGADKLAVEVSLDEANQSAMIALPTGRTVTRPALFAPDKVTVRDGWMTWIIDRTDLSFRRTFDTSPESSGEAGTCKLKPVPAKRAF